MATFWTIRKRISQVDSLGMKKIMCCVRNLSSFYPKTISLVFISVLIASMVGGNVTDLILSAKKAKIT